MAAAHDLDPALSVEMTRAEYALYRGCSRAAVDNAVYTGRITVKPGGLVDPQVADREWAENTGPKRGMPKPRGSVEGENGGPEVGGERATLTKLRAQELQLRLELTQADLDERRGNTVPKEEAERALEEEGQRVRDAVFQVAVQCAAAWAASGDPRECQAIAREALRSALAQCAIRVEEGADGDAGRRAGA